MAKFFFTQTNNMELIVEGGKPSGGSVVQTMGWMKSLNELNNQVFLGKYEEDTRPVKREYTWVRVEALYHSKKHKRRLVWFSYRFPNIFKKFLEIKPDFVYTSIPTWSAFYIGLICKILGIKHIIRIANDPDVDKSLLPNFPKFHEWLINAAYRMADLVLVQNHFQLQKLISKLPKVKVAKIANPIVLDKRYLKPKSEMKGYIAWLANFRYQKNLRLFYEIAINFPSETFKVGGEPLYPLDDETEVYLEKLKSLPNVHFVGMIPRDKVLEFLNEAKFLLNTSRFEGFSNTFLESMIVGTPILTTAAVNPDEIISGNGLGYIYKDASDLKGILEGIKIRDYRERSDNCINYVIENHDHLILGKRLLNILAVKY
jgi:glycosyltransferase involved in cell wall biosynthesis